MSFPKWSAHLFHPLHNDIPSHKAVSVYVQKLLLSMKREKQADVLRHGKFEPGEPSRRMNTKEVISGS
jgi:hypothetical protein